MATASPLSTDLIMERLSYSHIELPLEMDDPLKRAFYEVECLKGGWSVRELRRQIGSLYFERSGLSHDKEALSRLANADAEGQTPALAIRDPYVFEFLGLRPQEVLPESALEAALLAKLEAFLLELGHGFCFEARQKRLLIGEEAFFVDLVFYHRVLKCHVLVELKVDAFRHDHLGQLNTYVSHYRAHEMTRVTSRLLASCCAQARTTLWLSTPSLAWTTGSSSPNTNSNCQGPRTSDATSTNNGDCLRRAALERGRANWMCLAIQAFPRKDRPYRQDDGDPNGDRGHYARY